MRLHEKLNGIKYSVIGISFDLRQIYRRRTKYNNEIRRILGELNQVEERIKELVRLAYHDKDFNQFEFDFINDQQKTHVDNG